MCDTGYPSELIFRWEIEESSFFGQASLMHSQAETAKILRLTCKHEITFHKVCPTFLTNICIIFILDGA